MKIFFLIGAVLAGKLKWIPDEIKDLFEKMNHFKI